MRYINKTGEDFIRSILGKAEDVTELTGIMAELAEVIQMSYATTLLEISKNNLEDLRNRILDDINPPFLNPESEAGNQAPDNMDQLFNIFMKKPDKNKKWEKHELVKPPRNPSKDKDSTLEKSLGEEEKQELGKRLRLLLEKSCLSSKELSEKTGLTKQTISYHLNGKNAISKYSAEIYAQALGCYPDYLLDIDCLYPTSEAEDDASGEEGKKKMTYPKPIMKLSELKKMGFNEQWLLKIARLNYRKVAWKGHAKNSPWMFDTTELEICRSSECVRSKR